MLLSPMVSRFVSHFGEMGSRWGVNRTVGQIYALIFVSQKGLNADEIAEMLQFSRSNVGLGLKELQTWRLVRLTHVAGDRREYFEAPKDTWEIFRTLIEERRRREIEPTLSLLRAELLESPTDAADCHAQKRMEELHELIELSMTWLDDLDRLSPDALRSLMRMGSKVQKMLDLADRLLPGRSESNK